MGTINELKDVIEKKEYALQNAEKKHQEYEYLLQEIALYDDYVKSKLEEINFFVNEGQPKEIKISNVVFENKKL